MSGGIISHFTTVCRTLESSFVISSAAGLSAKTYAAFSSVRMSPIRSRPIPRLMIAPR